MIKLFVSVDLHTESGEPHPHTFCFNYGAADFKNFMRAVQDYMHNHLEARYIELNVDGKHLYGEDIIKAFNANNEIQLQALLTRAREDIGQIIEFPLEKVG